MSNPIYIRVNAKKTEFVEVDVSPQDIAEAALKLFDEKYKKFIKGEYIDSKTQKWMIYSYTHRGDDEYIEGQLATPNEIELMNIRVLIDKLRYP